MQDTAFKDGEKVLTISDNSELVRRFSNWEPNVRKLVANAGKVRSRTLAPQCNGLPLLQTSLTSRSGFSKVAPLRPRPG